MQDSADNSRASTFSSIAPAMLRLHLRDIPPSAYRLPADGRKWRAVCGRRRALALQLNSHADSDGHNIWAGRERLAKALGFSLREVGYRLADLVTLEFLHDDGWHGQTRRRSLDLEAIFQAWKCGHSRPAASENLPGRLGQNRADSAHGQNRGPGQNSVGHGQNSSGTLPPLVDLPKTTPPFPPSPRGAPLTVRDRRRLNEELWRLMDRHPKMELEEAIETASAELLIPLDQAWAAVKASGLGEARRKQAQKATA